MSDKRPVRVSGVKPMGDQHIDNFFGAMRQCVRELATSYTAVGFGPKNEFLKTDIFFFITAGIITIIGVLAKFILWHAERMLRGIKRISKKAAVESDLVQRDLVDLRNDVRAGKGRRRSLLGLFSKFTKRTSKKS